MGIKNKAINKVIIITGASSGIGRSLLFEAIKKNNYVAICSKTKENLSKLLEDLEKVGFNKNIYYEVLDVSNKASVNQFIKNVYSKFNKIDILINNAGISMNASFLDLDLKVIEQLMNVNFLGSIYFTKFALPYIINSKGTIVFISSIAASVPLPLRTGYCASKAAINAFANSLRLELKRYGVKVLLVMPGYTRSNIRFSALTQDGTPNMKTDKNEEKLMSPDIVAKKTFDAIEKNKRTLILTTEGILAYNFYKIIPSLLDKILIKKNE